MAAGGVQGEGRGFGSAALVPLRFVFLSCSELTLQTPLLSSRGSVIRKLQRQCHCSMLKGPVQADPRRQGSFALQVKVFKTTHVSARELNNAQRALIANSSQTLHSVAPQNEVLWVLNHTYRKAI